MQWVETTGKSVEEAKELALDQLGVDELDAEFEVIEEPRSGLFGRVRGEARIRARVAPKEQRPKQERRPRGRKSMGSASAGPAGSTAEAERSARPSQDQVRASGNGDQPAAVNGGGSNSDKRSRSSADGAKAASVKKEKVMDTDEVVPVAEQADIIEEFLNGLLDAFDLEAEVERDQVDDETIELKVNGDDLGLLIGPKGQTLAAVQDLSRTYLQRTATGTYEGRVRLDVGGYRSRRREALQQFTQGVADQVKQSGSQKILEPMGPADRKVVHDTVNEIAGVRTESEGQEPRRRVVIAPE